jgi:hypothetical protein
MNPRAVIAVGMLVALAAVTLWGDVAPQRVHDPEGAIPDPDLAITRPTAPARVDSFDTLQIVDVRGKTRHDIQSMVDSAREQGHVLVSEREHALLVSVQKTFTDARQAIGKRTTITHAPPAVRRALRALEAHHSRQRNEILGNNQEERLQKLLVQAGANQP